jgi:ABC-type glycerol-3-phosphate transport system substrate-binding protein
MRAAFLAMLALFLALYVLAEATLDRPPRDGIVRLRWSTDPAPARGLQTRTFAGMFPGIEVYVDPGDRIKLIAQCATGTGPDLVDVYSKAEMYSFVQAGILLDLTDYAKAMGFSPDATYPALKDSLCVNGRQYRFPRNVCAYCVVFNRKVFDDLGLAYPTKDWTYDDLIRIGLAIRKGPSKSGRKYIPVANFYNLFFFNDLLIGCGGRYFSEDGLASRLDAPEAVAAMQLYHDLMHVHQVIPTAAEASAISAQGGWGDALNWFSGGKAAMIFIGRWYILQAPQFPELKDALGAVQLPRVGERPSASTIDCAGPGINAKSPHIQEALKFLQYLASPEYGRLIVADGDSLPPNPAIAKSGADLVNEAVADPTFHQPFIDAIRAARPLDYSPFIDAGLTQRRLTETIERTENQLAEPGPAMRALAAEINQEIDKNLRRRPDLQQVYLRITGRPYRNE